MMAAGRGCFYFATRSGRRSFNWREPHTTYDAAGERFREPQCGLRPAALTERETEAASEEVIGFKRFGSLSCITRT